jgi:eukaryotic-like serine/threonine-protein kinase
MRRLLSVLGRTAYALATFLVFLLAAYSAFSLFVRSGVTSIPEVQGLSEEGARALLSDQGLATTRDAAEDRYDGQVPFGQVVEQRPRSGSLVKRGSAVQLVLSRGPNQAAVPSVLGESAQSAQVALVAAGFAATELYNVWNRHDAAGQVVMQDPPAGTNAAPASQVRLFVAIEASGSTFVMPDLVYRGYDEVRVFFHARGFRFGSIKFEPYEGVAAGTVLRHFPLAGHTLRRHEPISLVVAAERSGA